MQQVKIKPVKAFTQFELTQNLLQNLYKYDLTPTAKLVLLYLTSCYNPKNEFVFPKQKTIANKLGLSERTIVRSVNELVKAGLIIIECKYSNHYKFTSKIAAQCPVNMSHNKRHNDTKQDVNLSQSKQTNITSKEPLKVEDYKILKKYAISKGANNVQAYINKLIASGSAKEIIKEHKKIENRVKYDEKHLKETLEAIKFAKENATKTIPECFINLKAQLEARKKG